MGIPGSWEAAALVLLPMTPLLIRCATVEVDVNRMNGMSIVSYQITNMELHVASPAHYLI